MRDWFTKDLGWKLFSVLLALAIWLTVRQIRNDSSEPVTSGVENTYGDLSVAVVSESADVRAVQIVPGKVSVKVSGSQKIMGELKANLVHPFVNLTGLDAARDLKRAVEVSLPRGVTLVSVDPPDVKVTIVAKQQ